MATRYFTVEEAAEALAMVRPLAEEMVAHRRALVAATERRERVAKLVAANGGGIPPRELAEAQAKIEEAAPGLARCVERIRQLGVLVKDLDRGLVDFPALRGEGEEVLLCWQVGEPEIRYWHRPEDGFAGRRELPL